MKTLRPILLLILFINSFINFPTHANEAACTIANTKSLRAEFKTQYDLKNYDAAVNKLSPYSNQCTAKDFLDDIDIDFYHWLVSDLMLGQYKLNQFDECFQLGFNVAYEPQYGHGFPDIDNHLLDGTAISAMRYNFEKCREAALSIKEAGFNKKPCFIKGYANAIAVPQKWKQAKETTSCIYLNPGYVLTDKEDIELPESSNLRNMPPFLVLVTGNNHDGYIQQKIPFTSGKLSNGGLCGYEDETISNIGISVGESNGERLVLVHRELRFCWPGNASFVIDAVFTLDKSFNSQLKHEKFSVIR